MKLLNIILISLFVFIFGCSSSTQSTAPELPILTGKITRNMIDNDIYTWFKTGYDSFNPDKTIIDKISEKINNFEAKIYMGTWCGDSKREIPKFFKIVDKTNYNKFEITCLDKKKKSPEGTETIYKIEKIPTFIFFLNNKEVGRIIEIPEKTLEEDILKIISSN